MPTVTGDMALFQNLPAALRAMRARAGLRKTEAARMTGGEITDRMIASYETGEVCPSVKVLDMLLECYGVTSFDDLRNELRGYGFEGGDGAAIGDEPIEAEEVAKVIADLPKEVQRSVAVVLEELRRIGAHGRRQDSSINPRR